MMDIGMILKMETDSRFQYPLYIEANAILTVALVPNRN
jgi:hypothetical protein